MPSLLMVLSVVRRPFYTMKFHQRLGDFHGISGVYLPEPIVFVLSIKFGATGSPVMGKSQSKIILVVIHGPGSVLF